MTYQPGDEVEYWDTYREWVANVVAKIVEHHTQMVTVGSSAKTVVETSVVLENGLTFLLDEQGSSASLRPAQDRSSVFAEDRARLERTAKVYMGIHDSELVAIATRALDAADRLRGEVARLSSQVGATGGGVTRIRELKAQLTAANAELSAKNAELDRLRAVCSSDAETYMKKHNEAIATIKKHESSFEKWKRAEEKLEKLSRALKGES